MPHKLAYTGLVLIIIAFAIYTGVVNHRINNNLEDYKKELQQKDEDLQRTFKNIDILRENYQDSLFTVRNEEAYLKDRIESLDSILAAIPRKYEKNHFIIDTGSVSAVVDVLSNW